MTKNKTVFALAYAYLMVPFIIFLFGWLKLIYALPLTLLLGCAYYFMVKNAPEIDIKSFISKSPIKVFAAIALILIWVAYSGCGGFFYQNPDFMGRNGIFDALAQRSWPPVDLTPANYDFSIGLVYYFLTWLPAILVAKVFGTTLGTIFLGLWIAFGIWLTYVIIANKIEQKSALWILLLFIFFSGLDSVGIWLTGGKLMETGIGFCPMGLFPHIEWWTSFQFSSNSTQLYWVFNQAVPAWLATVLVVEQKSNRSIGLLLALLPLAALIPTFGLFVIAIYKIFENAKGKTSKEFWKDLISFENILSLIVVTIAFLFLTTNVRSEAGMNWTAFRGLEGERTWLLALTLEAFVWFAICFKHQRKNPLFYVCLISMIVFSRINIGVEPDFPMRSTIPMLIVLMMFVMSSVKQYWNNRQFISVALAAVIFILGAITPFMEIGRSVANTARVYREGNIASLRVEDRYNIFEGWKCENYAGRLDSFFFNVLAKEVKEP